MTIPDASTAPAPAAKSASLWEDFIDIFISPSDVYERRRNSGFFLPLLIFAVLLTALAVIGRPALQAVFDAEFARNAAAAMKSNPKATPEMMEKGRAFAEKFQVIGIFFFGLIAPLLTGVVLWIVGKFVDAKEDIKAACMIATYAFFPRLLESLLSIAQGFMMDPASLNGRYRLTLGVGRFLNPDTVSPVIMSVLGRIDVFTIWETALLAIGLGIVARIPKSRAAIAAVIVWVIGMIPGLLGALRAS